MQARNTSPCLTLNLCEDQLSQQSPFHPYSPCREGSNEQQDHQNSGAVREGAEERGRRKEAALLEEEAQCSPEQPGLELGPLFPALYLTSGWSFVNTLVQVLFPHLQMPM